MPITPTSKIWMNGELVPWDEARIHVLTHSLHYGMGVFEGIRAYETPQGPGVFRLTEHIERLERSARIMGMTLPYSVDELVQAMGLNGISKSTVSKLCKDIDERVGEFLNRPLTGEWPYVWLDATYLKVRQGGRIVPVAAIIAVAANTEGRREIIGLGIGPSEAETFWTEFLRSLRARGLGGVRLVISDAHTGLKAAIARVFEATWQRCRVHWMRNALAHVSRGQHTVVAAAIRQAFDQPDRAHAGETWRKVSEQLRPRWPKLADLMDASEHDVLAYMSFPRQHRTKLHSTNPIERLNKEVKRRADVVGIFPNEASIMRLIGAVLFEQNDEWQTSSRYMMVEAFARIDTEEIDPILSITTKAA